LSSNDNEAHNIVSDILLNVKIVCTVDKYRRLPSEYLQERHKILHHAVHKIGLIQNKPL